MRRPWNNVDFPVYSLCTKNEQSVNMNICTYVSPMSMKPKLYCIGIYYNTQTFENLNQNDSAILQFLNIKQAKLVNTFGKKSGFKYNKEAYLRKKNLLETWQDFEILKDCNAYLLLKKTGQQNIGGDHELFYFEVKKTKNCFDTNGLTNQYLIEKKIIL